MKILAVIANIYCVSLAICCTKRVVDFYKECGFDLGVFLLWALSMVLTGVGIYILLA